ncbi:hypothetical protein Ancab_004725 [Ancistrocladus abbreviatus]
MLGLKAVGDEGEVLQQIQDMEHRDHLAMVKANPVGQQAIRHVAEVLGSGNDTLFWFDVWSRRGQLATLFPRLFKLTIDKGLSGIRGFGMTIVGPGVPNGEDPLRA